MLEALRPRVGMKAALPRPRWETPLPAGVAGSWGPLVAVYARKTLAIELDAWQRRTLNRALAYDATWRLVHRHYLVSAGRQNGKTVELRSLIGWGLTAARSPAWTTFLGLAFDKTQARVPYLAVREDLQPLRKRGASLALTRYLGIRSDMHGRHREYNVASREAANAIRTFSVDVALFDEVRTQRGYDTWAALEPTTRARPDPLIFEISTAGDDRSVLLRDHFDRGRRIIDGGEPADGFGMTWYAADDELAPDDPLAIRQANPAVAEGRVPIGPVAASIRSLPTTQYRQETLNLWSEGADEWLPPGTWARSAGRQPHESIRTVFGVDVAPYWRRATIGVAVVTGDGAWVGIAGELDTSTMDRAAIAPRELIKLLDDLVSRWRVPEVAWYRSRSYSPHLAAWAKGRRRIRAIELGAREIRSASQLFRSELIGGRLTHAVDPLLAHHVRRARPSGPLAGDDWYFSLTDSVGEIDALRAVAWAAWGAIAPEARPQGHGIHV